ncbi:NHL repeat-containing protein 2-like isoform X1 [Montipora foliosa]|uniref:NHL repeat-containing protein 2-like isoform X1 n=1 Tax=Montipora foliosa TaxID=591990 RepID=UPI0035F1F103
MWRMLFASELGHLLLIALDISLVRVFSQDVGVVTTIAGGGKMHEGSKTDCVEDSPPSMDGIGTEARFNYPWGIVFDPTYNVLYVADCGCPETVHRNDRIRKIDVNSRRVTTLAGGAQGYKDGMGDKAKFHQTAGLAIDTKGRILYVADSANDRIRKIDLTTAEVTSFVGSGESGFLDDVGTKALLANPQQLELDSMKMRLYVSDTDNHAVRIISLPNGDVRTLVGGSRGFADGVGKEAKFFHPTGISLDTDSGILYLADHYNHALRTVDTTNGQVRTLAGNGREGFKDGIGSEARFNYPEGIAFDSDNKVLYVVEFDSNAVRIVTPQGKVSTLAGGTEGYLDGVGRQAMFYHPTGLTFDHRKKIIYLTDQYNHRIRSVSGIGSSVVDPNKSVFARSLQRTQSFPHLFAYLILSCLFSFVAFMWCVRRRQRLVFRSSLL